MSPEVERSHLEESSPSGADGGCAHATCTTQACRSDTHGLIRLETSRVDGNKPEDQLDRHACQQRGMNDTARHR